MNNSGDAAEQIVRLSLEGTEVAARITGSAAKNIAIMIYTILKNKDANQIRGRQRLTAMLKSGKELKVFSIKEEDLAQFAQESKRYGFVYCALRNKNGDKDGMVDVMVRIEDASKVQRVTERFKMASVDVGAIKTDIERTREEKINAPSLPKKEWPSKQSDDMLLDELLAKPIKKEQAAPENPKLAKTKVVPLSEPIFGTPRKEDRTTEGRPSVRKELQLIKSERKEKSEKNKIMLPPKTQEIGKSPKGKDKSR